VTEEQTAQFVTIIDGILATSDLATISAKKVRASIQNKVDHDITPLKVSASE
jgi:hypothetical protein